MRQLLLNIMLPKCVIVSTVAKYYKFDINVKLYFYKRVEIKELHSVESVCIVVSVKDMNGQERLIQNLKPPIDFGSRTSRGPRLRHALPRALASWPAPLFGKVYRKLAYLYT